MKLHDPDYLQFYLAKRDMTQAQLGRRVGATRHTIWQLLNVHPTPGCSAARAAAIEAALEVPPGTLFTEGPPPPPRRRVKITTSS